MTELPTVRTRFAPSPTGLMHVGNLRSALYEYLIAKSLGGEFILRIEDTDRDRLVEGAVEVIYETLRQVGLQHDEGPDIGGPCAPYVQSERLDRYRPHAEALIEKGHAYPCFCSKERLASLQQPDADEFSGLGYDRHCRDLAPETAAARMAAGEPYVIRQKMPLTGATTFEDAVFGQITVENKELEDQILIKTDGYPTYNFANVVDDHEMAVTHVVRGSEYLSSTPKYNLLYDAFGWQIPTYVHLPLILGPDGKKLSKRHGATSFADLIDAGYLREAIVNYIAFLGWAPGGETREFYTLEELCQVFTVHGISKAPAIFDEQKLTWFNEHYIREMTPGDFLAWIEPELDRLFGEQTVDRAMLAEILQSRLSRRSDLEQMTAFLRQRQPLSGDLFNHKKAKLSGALSLDVLNRVIPALEALTEWTHDSIHACLTAQVEPSGLKTGQIMGPVRIAAARQSVTPGGAIEMLIILGREEALARLQDARAFLEKENQNV